MMEQHMPTGDSSIEHPLPADTALSTEARIEQWKREFEQLRLKVEFNSRRNVEYRMQIRNNEQGNAEYQGEMMAILKRIEEALEADRG